MGLTQNDQSGFKSQLARYEDQQINKQSNQLETTRNSQKSLQISKQKSVVYANTKPIKDYKVSPLSDFQNSKSTIQKKEVNNETKVTKQPSQKSKHLQRNSLAMTKSSSKLYNEHKPSQPTILKSNSHTTKLFKKKKDGGKLPQTSSICSPNDNNMK